MNESRLAKSYRCSVARLCSAWERDYGGAIEEAAREGDAERLAELLRARRPLTDDDYERLADFIELQLKGRGQPPNHAAREATRMARTALDLIGRGAKRDEVAGYAASVVERITGTLVTVEQVLDRLRRGRKGLS